MITPTPWEALGIAASLATLAAFPSVLLAAKGWAEVRLTVGLLMVAAAVLPLLLACVLLLFGSGPVWAPRGGVLLADACIVALASFIYVAVDDGNWAQHEAQIIVYFRLQAATTVLGTTFAFATPSGAWPALVAMVVVQVLGLFMETFAVAHPPRRGRLVL